MVQGVGNPMVICTRLGRGSFENLKSIEGAFKTDIQCRMLYLRHRMSVLKAPSNDFEFSKDPLPRRVHMAIGFPTPCTNF